MVKWQKKAIWFCFLAGVAVFSGCSSGQSVRMVDDDVSADAEQIVAISEQLIGAPYRYGGESPNGFDCSGLVRYVYRQIGITVPHSSRLLHQKAKKVHRHNMQPGDLLFFNISKNKISHVGIYVRNGRFIHAPSSGKTVSVADLSNSYWRNKLIAVGRFH